VISLIVLQVRKELTQNILGNLRRSGRKFVLKVIKVFDDSNVGIQVPYKLLVDAKEVEYFN